MKRILDWFRSLYRRIFKRQEQKEERLATTRKLEAENFKGLQEFFKKLMPKRPNLKPTRREKKRGRGYTKPRYNFGLVKRRRKIAKASRRRNRGTK